MSATARILSAFFIAPPGRHYMPAGKGKARLWREVDRSQHDQERDDGDQRMHDNNRVWQPLLVHVMDGQIQPAERSDPEQPESPAQRASHASVASRQQQDDDAGYRQQTMERRDGAARGCVTAKVPDSHIKSYCGSECDQYHGIVEHARPPYRLFAARRTAPDS